jgi:hypothetical protein
MKKLVGVVALLCCQFFVNAQSGYKQAIGLRLTSHTTFDLISVSYKSFVSDHSALEFNLGYGGKNYIVPNTGGTTSYSPGYSVSGSYQYHELIETPSNENLHWFAGGGLNFFNISSKNKGYNGFGTGIFGTAGIDYKFKTSPVNVTADWRPTIYLSTPSAFLPIQIGTLGLAVRYTF